MDAAKAKAQELDAELQAFKAYNTECESSNTRLVWYLQHCPIDAPRTKQRSQAKPPTSTN